MDRAVCSATARLLLGLEFKILYGAIVYNIGANLYAKFAKIGFEVKKVLVL